MHFCIALSCLFIFIYVNICKVDIWNFHVFFVLPITALWHSNEKVKHVESSWRFIPLLCICVLKYTCAARSVLCKWPFKYHFCISPYYFFIIMCKIELFDCCPCVLHLLQRSAHDTWHTNAVLKLLNFKSCRFPSLCIKRRNTLCINVVIRYSDICYHLFIHS